MMLFWLFLGILSLNDPTDGINEQEENDEFCSTDLYDDSLNRNYVLPTERWPNATVLYKFDNNVNENEKKIFQTAISEIENVSCIRWKKKPENQTRPYVLITAEKYGCFAKVGVPPSGKDYIKLNLGRPSAKGGINCWNPRSIQHESLHIMGSGHEHNRADRDEHVDIHWTNVKQSKIKNFYKDAGKLYGKCGVKPDRTNYDNCSSGKDMETFGLPYDYDSIMHYNSAAHSANGKNTLTKKNGETIPFNRKLSNGDIKKLNHAYCQSDIEKKSQLCQKIKGDNLKSCTLTGAIFFCPVTCGVSNAKCRDQSIKCRQGIDCSLPGSKALCRKTCGQCQDCEDLIHSKICQKLAGTDCFLDDDMRYACNKTCELCNKPPCHDRNDKFCQKINETECVRPHIAHICAVTCGACNVTCNNLHPKCFKYSLGDECENEKYKAMCPLSCGTCDVCENLIEDGICKNIVSSNETICDKDMNVRYSCRKACGRCDGVGPNCHNSHWVEDECNKAAEEDKCDTYRDMCRGSCNSSCINKQKVHLHNSMFVH